MIVNGSALLAMVVYRAMMLAELLPLAGGAASGFLPSTPLLSGLASVAASALMAGCGPMAAAEGSP
ncbi:hypothetical protein GXW76_20645 [Roseomonas soli]|uniref:Uncharacterized protein n=1 Tax=Neoroseomonas soli TaxID=1081025 RepID=A0A9X9X2G4_9PROT|nr:hypothetical protein [Neoroseomonas soli]